MSCPMHPVSRKTKTIHIVLLLLACACSVRSFAQSDSSGQLSGRYFVPLNGFSYHLADRMDIRYPLSYRHLHTALKPYYRDEISHLTQAVQKADAMDNTDAFNIDYLKNDNREFWSKQNSRYYKGDLFGFFYPEPATFYQFFSVRINPVLHTAFGYSNDSIGLRFVNTRGVELRGSIDNKVGFYFYATDNQAILPDYVQQRVDAAPQVVPGEGVAKLFKDNGVDYLSARGYISFDATEHIQFQFGHDKIFIGDGIRSLIWSDNADDQLMLRIRTKLWRIQYMNMFTELANYDGSNIYNSLIHKKYAALHVINIPIAPTVQIGLFESIVFDRYDARGNETGFELNYLNPIIFYRAVESGLGSSDNATLGLFWKWNFLQRFSFYGQFILDEFVASEFIAQDGWWGNKYGWQSGIKYIDAFGIGQLDLQYEFNMVRPYTYSYDDDNGSSYTHYAQAIAHPLGANFKEHVVSIWYEPLPKLVIQDRLMLAVYGADSAGLNYGGNIFSDYNTYVQAYGNTIAQGIRDQIFLQDVLVSYYFWHNTSIDARLIYRQVNSELAARNSSTLYWSIGIRMQEVPRWNLF